MRDAIDRWMPLSTSGVAMPRDTMLITSVSASTAQIELHFSGFGRTLRQRADLLDCNAEVARDVLQELARARRALARHLVRQHLAARVDIDRPAVQRADVDHRVRGRVQEHAAARMRRHRIEVAGRERHVLALAGGGDVVDVVDRQAGVGEHAVAPFLGERHRVAAPDALAALRQPLRLAVLDAKQRALDGARADVDADRDGHGAVLPLALSVWLSGQALASTRFPSSTTARQANVAPPRAPV